MGDIDPRDFGLLEGQVEALRGEFKTHKEESQRQMAEANRKIDELLMLANQGRGAWWAALTAASAFGAIATYVTTHFWPR